MAELVRLTIDGVPVEVPKGTLLVEAARTVNQEIPVYCYHTKLGPAGLCRICLVEIEGMPKLQIACNTAAADGMVVHTRSDKAASGRAMVLELLLVNHPLDCPICDKGGECDLQDYAMAYGRGSSDVADPKNRKPKAVDLGPTIVLDEERCVVCQRCVRFDDIIVRDKQLVVKDRGHRDIIATATGEPYSHYFTGNVTELCPVGALTSKTYRFKSRPWDLTRTQTSCTQCAVGCRQMVDVRYGKVLRTMSVAEDDAISDGWLCDRGRYNVGFYDAPERLVQPMLKSDGRFVQVTWDDAFRLWANALRGSGDRASIAAIGGGRLTNEEAYVLQYLFRALRARCVDWRAGRQRQAMPGERGGTLAEIESAQTIVLACEPLELAPVFDLRIRKAVFRNGARLIRTLDARQAARDAGSNAGRIALVWDGVDLDLGRSMHEALIAAGELRTYVASEQPNARGAEMMGMLPSEGERDAFGTFADAREGSVAAMCIFGANPVRNAPAGAAVAEAFARTPFVCVSELFMTETAELATLVLPAKGAYEKSGTTVNMAGDLLQLRQSLVSPDGPLSDLEMLVGLAAAFGVELPTTEQVDAAVRERAAEPARFGFGDARFAPAYDARAPHSRKLFDGGGTCAHDHNLRELRAMPAETAR